MDSSKKRNKIREIVRLQQILKKWRKVANASQSSSKPSCNKKSIQLILKKTLSFSDNNTCDHTTASSSATTTVVPKGYLAVCVGEEQKRFVIPTEYLGRRAFHALLREAEEEFGFEQTGVLRIPCEVAVFERVLKGMESVECYDNKRSVVHESEGYYYYYCCTPESQLGISHHSDHSPLCR